MLIMEVCLVKMQTAMEILDSVLSSVHLPEIAMEAVEEYLPLQGPGSQTIGSLSPSAISSRLNISRAYAPSISAFRSGMDPGQDFLCKLIV